MSFYASLFSDSSCTYFSENNPSSFTNFVHNKIRSSNEEYEVAATHITYTNEFNILSSDADRLLTVLLSKDSHRTFIIPCKPYQNVNDLINSMMLGLSKITNGINIIEQNNTVLIRLSEGTLKLSSRLSKLLGFGNKNKFGQGDHLGSVLNPSDLLPYRLYLITDIIPSQIIGDKLLPVLRSFTNDFPFGESVSVDLEPYYVPVTKPEFSSISIALANRKGEIVKNPNGITEVSLHFRIIGS
jgi:hypothetical protein